MALAALLLASGLYTSQRFDQNLAFYQPHPVAKENIARADWLAGSWEKLPAFRDAFESKRNYPLNVQWLAPRTTIEQALGDQGWQTPHTTDMSGLLDLFSSDAGLNELPVLPQVHRGNTQQILLARTLEDRLLVLRLWDSGLREAGTGETLWTFREPQTIRHLRSPRQAYGKGVAYGEVVGEALCV